MAMYRPRAFAVDDADVLHAFIRANPFATLAAVVDGAMQIAYAPVVMEEGGVARFHLARGNPMAALEDGARLRLSFLGPHGYVSPDWYKSEGMVPTWNYEADEAEGAVRRLGTDALRALLARLSAAEEVHLLPKMPWTIDKVPEAKLIALMGALVGFEVAFETLEGKFKLSQNVKPEDFDGVLRGLDTRGDAASAGVASAMRARKSRQ